MGIETFFKRPGKPISLSLDTKLHLRKLSVNAKSKKNQQQKKHHVIYTYIGKQLIFFFTKKRE